ncbi:MAG: hypothetical protein ACPGYP_04905 [Solirubrobacterales bacterium]
MLFSPKNAFPEEVTRTRKPLSFGWPTWYVGPIYDEKKSEQSVDALLARSTEIFDASVADSESEAAATRNEAPELVEARMYAVAQNAARREPRPTRAESTLPSASRRGRISTKRAAAFAAIRSTF